MPRTAHWLSHGPSHPLPGHLCPSGQPLLCYTDCELLGAEPLPPLIPVLSFLCFPLLVLALVAQTAPSLWLPPWLPAACALTPNPRGQCPPLHRCLSCPRPCHPGELTLTPADPPHPSSRGSQREGREGKKSRRFVLCRADSGASDCQARLAVFNHFISVLGSPGRQPVLSSLLRKTSGRMAQRRLRAPIISCALRSALRSLPGEPVKN